MQVTEHVVRPADCVHRLAALEGIPWKKIWERPENEELRERREHANVLLPGDVVVIPALEIEEVDRPTEALHRFRKLEEKIELRVRVHDLDGPRAGEPYHAEVGSRVFPGVTSSTDTDGLAIVRIPADVTRAVLVVGEEEDEYELEVGQLDPSDSITGLHGRLENLGHGTGGVETPWDARSSLAMGDFLRSAGHDPDKRKTDRAEDDPNRNDLVDEHGI